MSADWSIDSANGHIPMRMDFVTETQRVDEESRTVQFLIKPDDRRYSEIDIDGVPHYLDKFLHHAIAREEMIRSMKEQAAGLPMFVSPRTIDSAEGYSKDRKSALEGELHRGTDYEPPTAKTKPQAELTADSRRAISFLSVDIQGSTQLRKSNPSGFDRAFDIFFRELGTVVGAFHGDIFKPTGDGFIAMIDYQAFTTQTDATVDLGLTMLNVLQTAVNPSLIAANLPTLTIRVGAEIGPAVIKRLAVEATGYSTVDIASDALNRSAKVEKSAGPNELRIGETLRDLLHVGWLLRCEEVDDFDAKSVGEEHYRVYRVL